MSFFVAPEGDEEQNKNNGKDKKKEKKGGNIGGIGNNKIIIIPDPISLIPRNPSVGLIFGPLTPALDNVIGLYELTFLQFIIGTYSIFKSRKLFSKTQKNFAGTEKIIKKFLRGIGYIKPVTSLVCGIGCIIGCGFEIFRLLLPYDPWYDEARFYRRLAIKNQEKPSAWFGAYSSYKPMSFKTWSIRVSESLRQFLNDLKEDSYVESKMGKSFFKLPNALETRKHDIVNDGQNLNPHDLVLLKKLNLIGSYSEIYRQLHTTNLQRMKTILDNDLKSVTEVNKLTRVSSPNKFASQHPNFRLNKLNTLPDNFSIESNDDFETAWENYSSWDVLKNETNYDIRLISHSRSHFEDVDREGDVYFRTDSQNNKKKVDGIDFLEKKNN